MVVVSHQISYILSIFCSRSANSKPYFAVTRCRPSKKTWVTYSKTSLLEEFTAAGLELFHFKYTQQLCKHFQVGVKHVFLPMKNSSHVLGIIKSNHNP